MKEFKRNDDVFVLDARIRGRVCYPVSYIDLKDCLPKIACHFEPKDRHKPFYQIMVGEAYFITTHDQLIHAHELN